MLKSQKTIVSIVVVLVLIIGLAVVAPVIYGLVMGPGVKTGGLNPESAEPASVEMDGQWTVVRGDQDNLTAVGFTFAEILPAEKKITSGSTGDVTGSVTVENETLTAGEIIVDMNNLTTDNERRDVNVRMKILQTDQYPEATFVMTDPVDLSSVPADGTPGQVELSGDLEIHGTTKPVTETFDILRDGEKVIISSDINFNRLDYGVESPEFVAAKIAEEGELNIRIALSKGE